MDNARKPPSPVSFAATLSPKGEEKRCVFFYNLTEHGALIPLPSGERVSAQLTGEGIFTHAHHQH